MLINLVFEQGKISLQMLTKIYIKHFILANFIALGIPVDLPGESLLLFIHVVKSRITISTNIKKRLSLFMRNQTIFYLKKRILK